MCHEAVIASSVMKTQKEYFVFFFCLQLSKKRSHYTYALIGKNVVSKNQTSNYRVYVITRWGAPV